MRALLYLRQSDTDGEGDRSLSLDSQASVLLADARRHGWAVIEEIRDADQKGWDDQRPGLLRLYDRCRAGDVDLVAVWSLSRLARSLKIQEHVFDELGALGVDVWSHEEPDVNRPLFRQILGAFNEEQTRVISAHCRRALQERAARGLVHGHVLYGYQHVEQRLVPDPDRAPIVRWLFDERAAGASYGDLIAALQQRGIPSPLGHSEWRKQTIRDLLTNPSYRGERRFGGKVFADTHEAIVSPEVWQRAQRRDDIRPRAPRGPHPRASWLEGLIVHECGRPMYLFRRQPPRQPSLRCASVKDGIRACGLAPMSLVIPEIETLVWDTLTADIARVSRTPFRSVLADAKRRYRESSPATASAAREANERRHRAQARRQRAEDLYLSGARDRAWFDAEDARTAAEVGEADAILQRLPTMPDHADLEQRWREIRTLAEDLDGITTLVARAALLRHMGSVMFGPGGVEIRYRPPLQPLFRIR
jgi:DNA invertase Pin-like site-specific DNA recombinase